ncbi:BgTH12-01504 [Blumeria graminis f. sp. triticale]|uniref:RING-type E3 ubiquitin transferase n=3 Tax=Blumeria graminis TaxID=34373 RepID=A0A061HRS8_BLUGR|nr:zinc finger protein 364 [Blumeria graminis f. sp. tritici 96224]CAD6501252.1 BgTH12-01504 [Blumeria graminis f. sp. triticale]VDB83669.1 Bgt-1547 [Blumeria graminis f. sp. tritici]
MAYRSSDIRNRRQQHLDTTSSRDVVYCHQCAHEWYWDENELICPQCESGITEIVTPGEDDPRYISTSTSQSQLPPSNPNHGSWPQETSDPDEPDIEEHISHGPNGSLMFSRTVRTFNPRSQAEARSSREGTAEVDTDNVLAEFRSMITNLIGPQLRNNTSGRSESEDTSNEPRFHASSFRLSGNRSGQAIVGGRIAFADIFSNDSTHPRDANEPRNEVPRVENITTVIGNILGSSGADARLSPRDHNETESHGLQALLSAIFLPINVRPGDVVHSQEALDQIISALMDQSPTSNAPGPASQEAITALPKKILDEKMLGPEAKGECSICMDDVKVGDEVMVLPCNHWFDEACVRAWLSEHNTCPICRKGITDSADTSESTNPRRESNTSSSRSRNEHRIQRLNFTRPRISRDTTTRNEDRLNFLRNAARLSPIDGSNRQPLSPSNQASDTGNTSEYTSHRVSDTEDGSDRRRPERPSGSRRRATSGNSGGGSSSALDRLRGLHDRFSNGRRSG